MKDKLLIIGASGHGKVIADIAMEMKKWKKIAFLDDNKNIEQPFGFDIIGKTNDVYLFINEFDIFVGIGNNATRKSIQEALISIGASIPILIHPESVISKNVTIGLGTVIMPGVIINNSTKIGKGCIVNTGSTVDHDCIIEDYVHISPGTNIAGGVFVGEETWLGIGSKVINNIKIIKGCKIGAGSVVVKDINKAGTYVGVPVRNINVHSKGAEELY